MEELVREKEAEQAERQVSFPRIVPSKHLDRVLYVDVPGSYVQKSGDCFVISKNDQVLREVPVSCVDEMVFVGNVNWSSGSLKLLSEHRIPVAMISPAGEFIGHFSPAISRHSELRIAQYATMVDERKSLALAKCVVVGKLQNMRTLLLRYARTRDGEGLSTLCEEIKRAINGAERAEANRNCWGGRAKEAAFILKGFVKSSHRRLYLSVACADLREIR